MPFKYIWCGPPCSDNKSYGRWCWGVIDTRGCVGSPAPQQWIMSVEYVKNIHNKYRHMRQSVPVSPSHSSPVSVETSGGFHWPLHACHNYQIANSSFLANPAQILANIFARAKYLYWGRDFWFNLVVDPNFYLTKKQRLIRLFLDQFCY